MIYNVYLTQNLRQLSLEIQPLDEPLSLDTHEIFSYISATVSHTSANHVLLGDFIIHHSN